MDLDQDASKAKAAVDQAVDSASATVKKVEDQASADVTAAKADVASAETEAGQHRGALYAVIGIIVGIAMISAIRSCT